MLRHIEVENIRLFSGGPWQFPIRPLTVFCGTNSSGKSTILKLLPLLRQTQSIDEVMATTKGALRFVGSQVDLGSYGTLMSSSPSSEYMRLKTVVDIVLPDDFLKFLFTDSSSIVGPLPQDCPCTFSCDLTFAPRGWDSVLDSGPKQEEFFSQTPPRSNLGSLHAAAFMICAQNSDLLHWSVERVEGKYLLQIPTGYFGKVGGFRIMEVSPQGELCQVQTVLNGVLAETIVAPWKSRGRKSSKHKGGWGLFALPPHMSEIQNRFVKFLSDIHYIAPLRSPARRYYITNVAHAGLDPAGDFLPYLLKDLDVRDRTVAYHAPSSSILIRESFANALENWIRYFRTGTFGGLDYQKEISVDTTKDVLVEFQIRSLTGEALHSAADSGFGYSQVLPILARGLIAPENSLLVIEQPELHLNPALQVRLAEFFVSLVKSKKQVIIETHSEHIVQALRVFCAEDETETLSEQIAIHFIDVSIAGIKLYDLTVRDDGSVPNWPSSFFGDALSLNARLLRAQRRHRGPAKGLC